MDKSSVQKRQRLDLERTIEELQELVRVTLDETPYQLEIDVPVGIFMEGFPGAIEQVVTNLATTPWSMPSADGITG